MLDKRLCWPQSQFGCGNEQALSPLGTEAWFSAHSAHSQVIILTEISWH